ncbi:hypothetical protein ACQEVU_42325 [Dactylosporangium sp. CA-139066]
MRGHLPGPERGLAQLRHGGAPAGEIQVGEVAWGQGGAAAVTSGAGRAVGQVEYG